MLGFRAKKSKNNSAGVFTPGQNGYQKYTKLFALTLLVGVFVFGSIKLAVTKFKSNPKVAAETSAPEIPAWWNAEYFSGSICDQENCKPEADPDQDGLTNSQEFYYHTHPLTPYTVGDELNDGQLVAAGFDPSKPGRVTFEEAASDDSVLLESLVFDQDVKELVAESNDISKVALPVVKDSELKLNYDGSNQIYQAYLVQMQSTVSKYFSPQDLVSIRETIKTGSGPGLIQIISKSEMLASDLKTLTVPVKFLSFHKYTIALYQLLPEVLDAPASDTTDPEGDIWYDKAQAFLAVQQKLDFEKQLLIKELGSNAK